MNKPIETPLGFLHGRDAAFLDAFSLRRQTATFELTLNRHLLNPQPAKHNAGAPATTEVNPKLWIVFRNVHQLRSYLLDEYPREIQLQSSFDQAGRCYVLATYDWVFEVECPAAPAILVSTPNDEVP